ncbi:hypothetical protein ACFLQ7_04185 [Actinomycetota bacterium]
MRHPLPLLILAGVAAVIFAGCASEDSSDASTTTTAVATTTTADSPTTGDIAFEHTLDMPSGTSAWTATGEAIDNDLFCSAATGVLEGFEDEDGAPRVPGDIEALFEAGEPFVNVSVESMSCEDAYADFELRFINEIDPSITDREPVTKVTWTITGGPGYDTTSGRGDNEIPQTDGDSFVYHGTGTITKDGPSRP